MSRNSGCVKTYFALHEEFVAIVKEYYGSKLDDLVIFEDAANHKLSVSEKCVKKSQSFLIDATPKSCESEETPRYTTLKTPILSNTKITEENLFPRSASANKCFNCDKDSHSLRDCPEPRNMNKIRRARNDFNKRELRYHDDDDEFSSFLPGTLTDELKSALGLNGNEIPLHVYKMRAYGYPPGWFEEAKVQNSGLSLFNGKDNEQNDDEAENIKIDVQKIYEYPGFNVPPEGQFVDRHRFYGVPPMLPQHSKEVLIQSLGENVVNGYKKRKLKESRERDAGTLCADDEMDLDAGDEEGITPLDNQPCPPGDDDRPPPPESPPPGSEVEDGELSNESGASNDLRHKIDDNPNDISIGHVATTIFGAPVLDSFSGFETLPAGDNFMVGVSDVIAFENLAESTGKYENMRELIKKVRCFHKNHQ